MVYFSGIRPKRTLAQKIIRRVLGTAAIALIVFILWQVPYDILREERFRIYGEMRTTGIVTEVRSEGASENGHTFFIDYKYIDKDGLARLATAPLPRDLWEKFRPGSRLEVLYISSQPGISRVPGEIEPKFQKWLRKFLNS